MTWQSDYICPTFGIAISLERYTVCTVRPFGKRRSHFRKLALKILSRSSSLPSRQQGH